MQQQVLWQKGITLQRVIAYCIMMGRRHNDLTRILLAALVLGRPCQDPHVASPECELVTMPRLKHVLSSPRTNPSSPSGVAWKAHLPSLGECQL